MGKGIEHTSELVFEKIKHTCEDSNKFWYARELQKILGYKDWRTFSKIIQKASEVCKRSNYNYIDHFVLKYKMVEIGSNKCRKIKDYKVSRYACYSIVQNCNSRIKIIAIVQTYFAVQTRKQELIKNKIDNEYDANSTHYNVGKDIRRFIKKTRRHHARSYMYKMT